MERSSFVHAAQWYNASCSRLMAPCAGLDVTWFIHGDMVVLLEGSALSTQQSISILVILLSKTLLL